MSVLVETSLGKIKGFESNGVVVWRGIPFAQPPLGALRWQPPLPAQPWAGARDAGSFPPRAMQRILMLPGRPPPETTVVSEDCLYLNICSPDARGRRPVLVWIHGGGFSTGSGAISTYDGVELARHTDAVVVTCNYRLGAFGFLPLQDILGDRYASAGICGMLDQIAALRWVRDNIAAFGGDPACVTVAGVSAGAKGIATLLAMPAARGLFQRAVLQSGGADAVYERADAEKLGREWLSRLGGTGTIDGASPERLPAEQILDAQIGLTTNPVASIWTWRPVIDGTFLPRQPIEAIADGSAAGIDLIAGTAQREGALFASLDAKAPYAMVPILRAIFGAGSEQVLAAHERCQPGASDYDILIEAMTAERYWIPAIQLAEAQAPHASVWMYRYDWCDPALAELGASHGSDIGQIWGYGDMQPAPDPIRDHISQQMRDGWRSFIHGQPPSSKLCPAWPPYDVMMRATMMIDREPRVIADPDAPARAAWGNTRWKSQRWQ